MGIGATSKRNSRSRASASSLGRTDLIPRPGTNPFDGVNGGMAKENPRLPCMLVIFASRRFAPALRSSFVTRLAAKREDPRRPGFMA